MYSIIKMNAVAVLSRQSAIRNNLITQCTQSTQLTQLTHSTNSRIACICFPIESMPCFLSAFTAKP
jgi:hypothetical protein